jgi:hypothetical protein
MMVNTAVFTCSICGEASHDICAYCTKDACSNHRCVRCQRCSDCCECESPLSAEDAAAEQPEIPVPAPAPAEVPELPAMSAIADFLTVEEASVFAPEGGPSASTAAAHDPFNEEPLGEDPIHPLESGE